jgi:hypothetical protein
VDVVEAARARAFFNRSNAFAVASLSIVSLSSVAAGKRITAAVVGVVGVVDAVGVVVPVARVGFDDVDTSFRLRDAFDTVCDDTSVGADTFVAGGVTSATLALGTMLIGNDDTNDDGDGDGTVVDVTNEAEFPLPAKTTVPFAAPRLSLSLIFNPVPPVIEVAIRTIQ